LFGSGSSAPEAIAGDGGALRGYGGDVTLPFSPFYSRKDLWYLWSLLASQVMAMLCAAMDVTSPFLHLVVFWSAISEWNRSVSQPYAAFYIL